MGKIEDLERLKDLKDEGVLTEEEFEKQKQNILNSTEGTMDEKSAKRASAGFVLGLCSLVAWFIPLIGYPVTILGIIFSSLGMNSNKKGMAITGIVLSIIFFIVTLMNSIVGAIMMSKL